MPDLTLISKSSKLKRICILHHHRPFTRNRQVRNLPLPIAIQQVIVHDIKVIPFPGIIAEPDIPRVHLLQAVVLQEGGDGKFGVQHVQRLQAGEVGGELLFPLGKAGEVVAVIAF